MTVHAMKCPVCNVIEALPTSPSPAMTDGLLVGLCSQAFLVGMISERTSSDTTILCATHDAWAKESALLFVEQVATAMGHPRMDHPR